jgi:hypothetical protein
MANAEHPLAYQFYRPILWDNGDCPWRYSNGGTANIVRLGGELFILTAKHCLEKESQGWTLDDCRIPWRIQSEAYCKIGKGTRFAIRPGDSAPGDCELLHCDVAIHRLEGPSCDAEPLESGEFLDLISFDPSPDPFPRFLSGFPAYDQDIDYEAGEILGNGWTIQGRIEPSSDELIHRFHSPSLAGVDANGYSGGLVTCNVLGNVSLEGMCIQGSGNLENDFIHFLGIDVLGDQLVKAHHSITRK